jgi:hypothetical protein
MKSNNNSEKIKTPLGSIILYILAAITFLVGIASLINNIVLFQKNVAHYVEQGYPYGEVFKGLAPSQLLPGIFEPVAVYIGIAVIIFSAGLINKKISALLKLSAETESDTAADTTSEPSSATDADTSSDTTSDSENSALPAAVQTEAVPDEAAEETQK